jgi:hypothetical protein
MHVQAPAAPAPSEPAAGAARRPGPQEAHRAAGRGLTQPNAPDLRTAKRRRTAAADASAVRSCAVGSGRQCMLFFWCLAVCNVCHAAARQPSAPCWCTGCPRTHSSDSWHAL